MYSQPQHQLVLTDAHAAALRTILERAYPPGAGDDDAAPSEATTEVLTALSAALAGAAVTLKAKAAYVPLKDALRLLGVSETGLRRWLEPRGMQTYREGARAYMRRRDLDELRAWRISLSYPEPE